MEIGHLGLLQKELVKLYPKSFPRFHPRIYKNADRWADFRLATFSLTALLGSVEDRPLDRSLLEGNSVLQAQAVIGTQLAAHQIPMFFVEKELLHACLASSPPETVDWQRMKLPFEAAIFVLPKNSVFFSDGSECGHIVYGRIPAGRCFINEFNTFNTAKPYFMVFATSPNGYTIHHLVNDLYNSTSDEIAVNNEREPFSIRMDKDEAKISRLMMNTAINLILAMLIRPELRETGKRVGYHKKQHADVFTPNTLGTRYRVSREMTRAAGGASAGKVASGVRWRRGHFREQACGTGYSLRRTIWIEPILIDY